MMTFSENFLLESKWVLSHEIRVVPNLNKIFESFFLSVL